MNKTILNFINKCEKWKVEIKENHWAANSLSQHELCDDIASEISDFEDLVSEVEQSINGKFKNGELNPEKAERVELKPFVEEVISSSQEFLKELDDMGEKYIGIKSECEAFIGTMQRKLYLVNFTLKEELKNRLREKINESMPKNLGKHDEVDKFMGRRPKTIKARINQIYRIVKKYGIDSRKYTDEHWQAIEDYYRAIASLGCEVEMKPCAHMANADSMQSDGGYCDYAEDGMPRSKQYAVKIMFEDGMNIDGYIKCMAAGTMEDPFSSYDTCIVLWPKSNRVLENKNIKLTESELKQVIKEATIKLITEIGDTPQGREALMRLSGRRMAQGSKLGADLKRNGIEGGDDKVNGYFNRGLDAANYADIALDKEIRKAVGDKFHLNYNDIESIRDIIKKSEAENMHNAYKDEFYGYGENKYSTNESKESKKVTEEELKTIVKEAAMKLINEYGDSLKGAYKVGKLAARQSFRDKDPHKGARTLYQSHSENNNDKKAEQLFRAQEQGYDAGKKEFNPSENVEEGDSGIEIKPENKGKFTATKKATGKSTEELTHSKNPLTRKRANFAKMAKRGWKPLKKSE